jgi:transposase
MRRDALCGAHLLRELRAAFENESQGWAKKMFDLLSEMNGTKNATPDGVLPRERIDFFKERYRAVLASGEAELPPPEPRKEGARGRAKSDSASTSAKCFCSSRSRKCPSRTILRSVRFG